MADRKANIIIKNVEVAPQKVFNDGSAEVRLSASVFSASDNSKIKKVSLEAPFRNHNEPLKMKFQPAEGIKASGEGKYSCSFEVPLLTDPGTYDLPIMGEDDFGSVGKRYAPLVVEYKNPYYPKKLFAKNMSKILDEIGGSALTEGNRVRTLFDGDESFSKRLELIQKARKQINLQTYALYAEGKCGKLTDALLERARKGVEVNIILNFSSQLAVSPLTSIKLGLQNAGFNFKELAMGIERARDGGAGVRDIIRQVPGMIETMGAEKKKINVVFVDNNEILGVGIKASLASARSKKWLEKIALQNRSVDDESRKRISEWLPDFRGPAGLPGLPGLTYAVHEKILVVDGRKAIVGGRNLEDRYFTRWIDKDLLIEGPVVEQIQNGFARSWKEFNANIGRKLQIGEIDTTPDPGKGGVPARFVQSRPWRGEYNALEFVVTALQMARDRVLISSQYIVMPDSLLKDALFDAANRGVKIHIITNSLETSREIGVTTGYLASFNYFEELIKAGICIYEVEGSAAEGVPNPYFHTKEFLIDGKTALMGSFNLSIRSSYVESENIVCVENGNFVQAQEKIFWDIVKNKTVEVTPAFLKMQQEKLASKISLAKYFELFL